MATRIGDYRQEVTEPSRLELMNIARWLQEHRLTAYLVGGWAVYFHTKPRERPPAVAGKAIVGESKAGDRFGFAPLGSKDIDLVFENKKARERFEQEYCRENGYRKHEFLGRTELAKFTGTADIILDLDLLSNTRVVRGITVRWSEMSEHSANIVLDGSALAPSKELLLLYKCVALVERTDERNKPYPDLNRLESKIWKDANDVLALHDAGINSRALEELAKKTGLAPIVKAAKQIIAENYDEYEFKQYAFSKQFLEEE